MVVNKKLGKGLSSLLGNKGTIQSKNLDEKGLLLIQLKKYLEMMLNLEKNLIKKRSMNLLNQ